MTICWRHNKALTTEVNVENPFSRDTRAVTSSQKLILHVPKINSIKLFANMSAKYTNVCVLKWKIKQKFKQAKKIDKNTP